jgi:hypothetical protein
MLMKPEFALLEQLPLFIELLVIRYRLVLARERVIPNDPIVMKMRIALHYRGEHDPFRTARRGWAALSKPNARPLA